MKFFIWSKLAKVLFLIRNKNNIFVYNLLTLLTIKEMMGCTLEIEALITILKPQTRFPKICCNYSALKGRFIKAQGCALGT
ncbi:MAG: hypothetical protein DRR19_13540 [Candidatus Parabeggiatoa sp. nov. 1]|nr:MAG: hypothetical protein DRR19_13540 [Gammaproteobacteria bacterium]